MRKSFFPGTTGIFALFFVPYIVTIIFNGANTTLINKKFNVEMLLPVIVSSQIEDKYEIETIKAQTIIARSNFYRTMKEEKNLAITLYQIKKEMEGKSLACVILQNKYEKAVTETEGKVIVWNKELKLVPYHELSAGQTRDGMEVFHNEDDSYLRSVHSLVDMDHLGGLLYNLRNKIKLSIEEVWMNHGSLMGKNAELSVKQNDEVYTALKEQGIPVKPVIAGTTYELDGAVFRVLWPDEETLYRLFPQPLGNVVLGKPSDYGYSFGELMNMPIKGKDTSPNNRASVIMEVAYKGQKLLFTGDAWAEDILQVVGNSSYDFIKLSHHGSVRNLSEEWSGKIKCQTYMICADGSTHPDKQTIAKLLKWNDEITIYGSTDWWTSMLNIEEQAKLEKIHFEEGEYLWKLPKKE